MYPRHLLHMLNCLFGRFHIEAQIKLYAHAGCIILLSQLSPAVGINSDWLKIQKCPDSWLVYFPIRTKLILTLIQPMPLCLSYEQSRDGVSDCIFCHLCSHVLCLPKFTLLLFGKINM